MVLTSSYDISAARLALNSNSNLEIGNIFFEYSNSFVVTC